jgi:hypothetical protein
MEQKFILLVYYKGVAPMEQEITAVHNRRRFSPFGARVEGGQSTLVIPVPGKCNQVMLQYKTTIIFKINR